MAQGVRELRAGRAFKQAEEKLVTVPSIPDPEDESLVRNQPALVRSRGNEWVLIGAIFAAVTIGALLFTNTVSGIVGAVINGGLFLAMLMVRVVVPLQRPRLWTLAVLLGSMAASALITILIAIATL